MKGGVGHEETEWGSIDSIHLSLDMEFQVSDWWKVSVITYKNSTISLFF